MKVTRHALVIISFLALATAGSAAAQQTVMWVSSGGAYQDAERKAFIEPIAKKLGISEHTAKFHVNGILLKLNANTRTEAVVLAARRGLLMI